MTINSSITESAGFEFFTPAEVRKFDRNALIARTANVREAEQVRKADGAGIMWNAALLFGAVMADPTIVGKADGTVWNTQGDYVEALGYSPAMGTILKRCNVAQTLGLPRTAKEWTFLVQFGGNARVGEAVKSVEPGKGSRQRLEAALRPLMQEVAKTGKVAAKAKGAQTPASEKGGEESGEKGTDAPAKATGPVTVNDLLHHINAMRVPTHNLSADDWSKVEDALEKFRSDENNRRILLAQKSAKATPATVAKVAKAS